MIAGYRRQSEFRACIYKDTIYKQVINRIKEVNEDGTVKVEIERRVDG